VIVTLCGGVGAARFLAGLVQVVDESEIVAIVNTGDDLVLHGLSISPDLDTVSYTLAGLNNTETGWGVKGETWRAMQRLSELGGESWFSLGDLDLATHLFRSQLLAQGATLTEATNALRQAMGIGVKLLPMSDQPVATKVTSRETGTELDFQEYFVRHHHEPRLSAIRFAGAETAQPGPEVLASIALASRVIIAPSNPLVSLGPILAVAGIADALQRRRADTVAISPIVAGTALKGPAADMLEDLGQEVSVVGVARLYAPYAATFIIDEQDADHETAITELGMNCVVTNTVMDSSEIAASLARTTIEDHA
jgi:LPPG:FO 2-phospho-L-lactate transferase